VIPYFVYWTQLYVNEWLICIQVPSIP
jgi:hypothetical protein